MLIVYNAVNLVNDKINNILFIMMLICYFKYEVLMMIKCNLVVLMAERGLKIADIATGTGMSRTTVSSLMNHNAKGIQYDTFNTLCEFLKVTPGELFIYEPFKYSFEMKRVEDQGRDMTMYLDANVKYKNQDLKEEIPVMVMLDMNDTEEFCYIGIEVKYAEAMANLLAPIPRMFIKDMETEIKDVVMERLAQEHPFAEDLLVTMK